MQWTTATTPRRLGLAHRRRIEHAVLLLATALLASCGESATIPLRAGIGDAPQLPKPNPTLIPTVNIAPAIGWSDGTAPTAAAGFQVRAFAAGLDHPRWLHVLPNGDVLVAETNAPSKPQDGQGIKGAVMKSVMKKAGAGVPSANRIPLLRDADGDGVADMRSVLLDGLNSPFGMSLVDDRLYIANSDALMVVPYRNGATRIDTAPRLVAALPAGPINHHWTKNVIASADGLHLYVAVGSNSNVAENGIEAEQNRAAILEVDADDGDMRVFASGLRNPVGLAWHPTTGALWTVVNERDEIGSDLVPDYLTSVRRGAFYGWPYSYYGQHVDMRVAPSRADLVASAIAPDYALGAHVAALGLAFYDSEMFPARYRGGAFIGEHGSWNRKPRSGYKVVFVPFANGKPNGYPEDILTGFVDRDGNARGWPVGVVVDRQGALLVADDVGNTIWRVTQMPR